MKTAASPIVLAALLGFASACSEAPVEETPSGSVDAASLYRSQQCALCHGSEGQGMNGVGPDLRGMEALWTVDELMSYLADPKGYTAKDERLSKNQGKYRMPMPQNNLDDTRRRALAEYVLALD